MDKIFSKAFLWMFIGVLTTFGVGYFLSTQENIMYNLFSGYKYMFFWILEFVVVIVLTARINRLSVMTAKLLFIAYSFLTGITLSSIFIIYNLTSIIFVFLVAAILFLIFGLIGYFTKVDITKLGSILMMTLIGLIICSILNIFIKSSSFDLGITYLFLLVFLGFTAYDINAIKKRLYNIGNEDNLAIYCALQLYLDFINIFLELLKLFGKRRD